MNNAPKNRAHLIPQTTDLTLPGRAHRPRARFARLAGTFARGAQQMASTSPLLRVVGARQDALLAATRKQRKSSFFTPAARMKIIIAGTPCSARRTATRPTLLFGEKVQKAASIICEPVRRLKSNHIQHFRAMEDRVLYACRGFALSARIEHGGPM